MGAAKLAVASALLLWFLWRARENRLFLLGIPVLMVMGEAVFFDRMRPFWTPGRFLPETHIMGWLFVVWVLVMIGRVKGRTQAGPLGPGRLLPEEVPLLLIAALVVVHVVIAALPTVDIGTGVAAGMDMIYLLLGYLLVRGIVSQFSRHQVVQFLTAVVLTNTLAATLYVVHQGLGVKIYTGGEYFTTEFAGAEITRTFHFAPMFSLLALGFVLARPKWTPGWLLVLAITVLSILVSYTRTLVIAVVVAVVIAIVVHEFKSPSSRRFLRRAAVILASVIFIGGGFALVLPARAEYALSRLTELTSAGSVSEVGNWQVRVYKYDTMNRVVLKNDPFLGMGFPAPGSNPVDAQIYRLSADMTWIPIVYHVGYFGLALFAFALFAFAVRSLRLTLSADEVRRYLGLTYLITIALTVLVAFTAWTFMQPQIAPMGLWFLAFVAAEALAPAAESVAEASSEPTVKEAIAS